MKLRLKKLNWQIFCLFMIIAIFWWPLQVTALSVLLCADSLVWRDLEKEEEK